MYNGRGTRRGEGGYRLRVGGGSGGVGEGRYEMRVGGSSGWRKWGRTECGVGSMKGVEVNRPVEEVRMEWMWRQGG